MKKKTARHTRKKQQSNPQGFFYYKRRIIYFVSIIFVLLAGVLLLPNHHDTNRCANTISCISDLSGTYDEDVSGIFEGDEVVGPALASKPVTHTKLSLSMVLGETTVDTKRIAVDLTKQRLYAYENNNLVFEFPISSGRTITPTPTGDFRIWIKLRHTRMKGGSKLNGTYYDLPNVPYTMYFSNDKVAKTRGYGIHGAYWHNNFGHPMSHGCINMREEDVAKLYYWTTPAGSTNVIKVSAENPGTLVSIYGTTPTN